MQVNDLVSDQLRFQFMMGNIKDEQSVGFRDLPQLIQKRAFYFCVEPVARFVQKYEIRVYAQRPEQG